MNIIYYYYYSILLYTYIYIYTHTDLFIWRSYFVLDGGVLMVGLDLTRVPQGLEGGEKDCNWKDQQNEKEDQCYTWQQKHMKSYEILW